MRLPLGNWAPCVNASRSFSRSIRHMYKDTVFIDKISGSAITGKDAWHRPVPQPISVSVALATDFSEASATDDLKYSLNYAVITRNIAEYLKAKENHNFKSLKNIAEGVALAALDEAHGGGQSVKVTVSETKSQIRAESLQVDIHRSTISPSTEPDTLLVSKLRLLTLIGVFTFERLQKQIVDIDLTLHLLPKVNVDISSLIASLVAYVESTNFKTVEALVLSIGQLIFEKHGDGIAELQVRVTKPNAISITDGVGVSSTMDKNSFDGCHPLQGMSVANQNVSFDLPTGPASIAGSGRHVAYIAFGSNVGDVVENISRACACLEARVKIEATSSMYTSRPMYHLDQEDFYNGVLKISFEDMMPHDLLRFLKLIEYDEMHRVKDFENGPRSIDLDILLYDDISINTPDLTIPHKSMLERTFVLQPLCELIAPDFVHPVSAEPIRDHLTLLMSTTLDPDLQESLQLVQVIPLRNSSARKNVLRFDLTDNNFPTLIMGVLNYTPDSFSDKEKTLGKNIVDIVAMAEHLVIDGAVIIDIGGVSTRPGSSAPDIEEEIARVVPVIRAIRASPNPDLAGCLLSIDTFRSEVAEAALAVGADIINDVSMGLRDEKIFDVVAKYACPYIASHSRGTPKTMGRLTEYLPNEDDGIHESLVDVRTGLLNKPLLPLMAGVCRELSEQILKAFEHGVKKWQIIIDPGLGFAKSWDQNVEIIRDASLLKKYCIQVHPATYFSMNGLALLMGPSRKKFLGDITNEPDPTKRVVSTCALIVACVQQDCDIVRVHDVEDVKQAARVADAIYKGIQ